MKYAIAIVCGVLLFAGFYALPMGLENASGGAFIGAGLALLSLALADKIK
ncbi:TPA: hypothetical protein L5U90_003490 [Pseudomonas aeruginosa]|nr:hypothetical protein [Pseudomonas aeruginosa]